MKRNFRCKVINICILFCFTLAIFISTIYNMSIKSQNGHVCKEENYSDILMESNDLSSITEKSSFPQYFTRGKEFGTRKVSKEEHNEGKDKAWLQFEAQSDRKHVYLAVNGIRVYEINEIHDRSRGMHVIVIDQLTGQIMAVRVFDFYNGDDNSDFTSFLNALRHGRIVVFLVKDEASFGFKDLARKAVKSFGSKFVNDLGYREHWACIARRKSGWVVEDVSKRSAGASWPDPVRVRISLTLDRASEDDEVCKNVHNEIDNKRKAFCRRYVGYESVCDCSKDLYKKPPMLKRNNLANSPIVIIASKRPRYLFKMLQKLLSVSGTDQKRVIVFIDGDYNETRAVAEIFGLKVVVNKIECKGICRVQQHYRQSLSKAFDDFPNAKAVIILEDDLEVSDDIFDYFSQTFSLLEEDSSIYCISAWNDQGYIHSVNDSSLLYRVETMPGLGWMLSRSLYKNELEAKWPGNQTYCHWDIWLRKDENRKGRECIIPDVSRTYHFGAKGLNTNNRIQNTFFKSRSLNIKTLQAFDVDKMKKNNYEKELDRLITNAKILNYTKPYCKTADDIIPNTQGKTYVIFIKMEKNNKERPWIGLARCLKLWDRDMRGFHKGLIRFWIKENHIIVIGSPESHYAHYRPNDIVPVDIK